MNAEAKIITTVVGQEHNGCTVAFILKNKLRVSESLLRRVRRANCGVTLDGAFCRTDAIALAGQTIQMIIPERDTPTSIEPEEGPLDIVYEDDDLLILNKDAETVVHPSRGHWTGTLCNFVAHYLSAQQGSAIPHPANRLDRETTGLVMFAKHAHAQNLLQDNMHSTALTRTYLAICTGLIPDQGTIDAPIARIRDTYGSFGVRGDGKRAVTHFSRVSTIAGTEPLSLARIVLETGRTHQIRVHTSHIGHALLGDTAYGIASHLIARPALHSWRIDMTHPITGESLEIEAPLPHDMRLILDTKAQKED